MKRILMLAIVCSLLLTGQAQKQVYTLKSCLEEGLQNNYSLRITHNEEQVSKNNATLGNPAICLRSISVPDTKEL